MTNGCQSNKISEVNYESEKAKIEKISKENFDLLVKGDKQELIKFIRKFSLPKGYSADQYSIIFQNIADSTDEAIAKEFFPKSFKFISFTDEMKPIIKVSQDGKMAYCLGKDLMKTEYDSMNIKKVNTLHYTYLAIFEKKDSIWQEGDIMQVTHR
jgi:hypothetical protein